MNLEELSTYDLEVQIKQGRYQMLGASGKEKARLTAKLLELIRTFLPKNQRYVEAMVEEGARLLLEYEPMQQWFREVFGEGYKIRGVYEPEANDVDGAQKGAPMSHEEANEHRANPFFKAGVKDSYSRNCQTCVVAYELRRRGYDVMAVPRDDYATGILAHLVNLAWVDPKTKTYPVRMVSAKVVDRNRAVKWFEKVVKPGERYLLTVIWEKGGGHVVILTRNEVATSWFTILRMESGSSDRRKSWIPLCLKLQLSTQCRMVSLQRSSASITFR